MNKHKFLELILSKEYNFLRENEHLGDNICYLTLGGSYLYGTNNDKSDVDIRGIALNSKSDLIGFSNFEHVIDNNTDTTIYSFNKIIKLLLDCNPNCIELLSPREDIYIVDDRIKKLFEIKHAFLSKKAKHTFLGYTHQQLRRLENALCHDRYNDKDRQNHLYNTLSDVSYHIKNKYNIDKYGDIDLIKEDNDDIVVHMCIDGAPINDICIMFKELNEIIKTYNKLNGRNKKKDDNHLNKHAMHLIRLLLMGIDIFEKEKVISYRKNDIELLLSIRNGKYMNKDGTYSSDFFDMVDEYQKRFDYAYKNTNLPDKPDYKLIEEFVMSVNKNVIYGE